LYEMGREITFSLPRRKPGNRSLFCSWRLRRSSELPYSCGGVTAPPRGKGPGRGGSHLPPLPQIRTCPI